MDKKELYRALPNMDELLENARIAETCETHGRAPVISMMRNTLEDIRSSITLGTLTHPVNPDAIVEVILTSLAQSEVASLRRVVNATGIIVHTNLGRSVLADEALDAVAEVAGAYSTLEYDLDAGERGSRHAHIEQLLCELTGAQGALAVNNNAAAVMLVLTCFGKGKEAIISRGQLVEIGGSFRIPDIMAQSGVKMVEVGTTNKTRLEDYGRALTSLTGLLLKVHTSNYEVVGFSETPTTFELAQLGMQYDIPLIEDQGSGVLIDLKPFGLPYEPTVPESLYAGASVVTFSGDKLLGGPQAGIIVGQKWAIDELKAHPMVRALRLDKMTLAALEATLKLYRDHDLALRRIPTLRMLTMSLDESDACARELLALLQPILREGDTAEVGHDIAYAGGGSLPLAEIPSMVVRLKLRGLSATDLERSLRTRAGIPVISRIHDDRLTLDPRTFVHDDHEIVAGALAEIISADSSST